MTRSYKENRTENFRENEKLNHLIEKLSVLLKPVQTSLKFDQPKWPIAFIIGSPRSGTSVFLQWMASLGCFSYPTNVLSRFAYAPYIGALIQQMLFNPDYDFQGELADIQSGINFSSDLGKSLGALATSEFQHFFRNYIPTIEIRKLSDKEALEIDFYGISQGLASIEKAFNKPFVTKANLLQYHANLSAQKLPKALWIHIKRDPLMVMQSLLISRERYYGTRDTWWSCKPQEYPQLANLDVYHQVAGQVYYTEKAIEQELSNLDENCCMTVQYEDFCSAPACYYDELVWKYSSLGYSLPAEYTGPESFESRKGQKLSDHEVECLRTAYELFINKRW